MKRLFPALLASAQLASAQVTFEFVAQEPTARPGGSFLIEAWLHAPPEVPVFGFDAWITASAPDVFSIASPPDRTGSVFDFSSMFDAMAEWPDPLKPTNRNPLGSFASDMGAYSGDLFLAAITLSVSPAAPLGTYTLVPGGPWVTWIESDGDSFWDTPFDELRGVNVMVIPETSRFPLFFGLGLLGFAVALNLLRKPTL